MSQFKAPLVASCTLLQLEDEEPSVDLFSTLPTVPLVVNSSVHPPLHRSVQWLPRGVQQLWQMGQRFIGFGLVGGGVMVGGIVLLYLLVRFLHVNQSVAYAIQSIVSIEANFLLNRFLNWRDRGGNVGSQWLRFHITKIGTVALNQELFALLVHMGVFYLLATVINVAISTVLNYVTNNIFVFVSEKIEEMDTVEMRAIPHVTGQSEPTRSPAAATVLDYLPHVGVVIPVRNAGRTISACLDSVLAQDYQGPISIFLVGNSPDQDSTWHSLGDQVQNPRVHVIQLPRMQGWVGRDANMKRYTGSQAAIGHGAEVVALLDSQVYAPPNWLSTAVPHLKAQHVDGVAGISCRNPSDLTLSGLYQDESLFSEWPRYGDGMLLTKETFNKGKGLPITANLLLTRKALLRLGNKFPIYSTSGWDDFQLSLQLVQIGCTLYCTNEVRVYRNHVRKFRLVKQFSSGISGVVFYRDNPKLPYARLRMVQAVSVVLAGLAALVLASYAVVHHTLLMEVVFAFLFYLAFSAISIWKARDWRGILFLFLDIMHIGIWVTGASYAFCRKGQVNPGVLNLLVKLR